MARTRIRFRMGAAMVKILVVDDIDDVADSLGELLRLFGYDVSVAYSAEQAISRIEACLPDVVLTDINMPVVNGFELARQIRRRCGARIRLVAHTAYPRSSIASQAEEAGFNSFVSKSAQPLELALAVGGRARAAELRSTALRDRRQSQRCSSASRRATDSRARFAARAKAGAGGDASPVPVRLPQSDKTEVRTRAPRRRVT